MRLLLAEFENRGDRFRDFVELFHRESLHPGDQPVFADRSNLIGDCDRGFVLARYRNRDRRSGFATVESGTTTTVRRSRFTVSCVSTTHGRVFLISDPVADTKENIYDLLYDTI